MQPSNADHVGGHTWEFFRDLPYVLEVMKYCVVVVDYVVISHSMELRHAQ